MTYLEVAPLHRLLERRETAVLLDEFAALMSGVELALFGADGRPFVGRVEWLSEGLAEVLEQARMGRTVYEGDRLFVPLMAGEQVVGVLAVCGPDLTHPPVDHALHCLRRSLGMLVAQALEKRSVARETLERYREINLLYNIGETIGTCLDPEEIPRLVLVEANRVIRADVGVVLLPNGSGARHRPACHRHRPIGGPGSHQGDSLCSSEDAGAGAGGHSSGAVGGGAGFHGR